MIVASSQRTPGVLPKMQKKKNSSKVGIFRLGAFLPKAAADVSSAISQPECALSKAQNEIKEQSMALIFTAPQLRTPSVSPIRTRTTESPAILQQCVFDFVFLLLYFD
jgi:hypothetical protein